MANKPRKPANRSRKSRSSYLPWPWWFWPVIPVSQKQLAAAEKVVKARGEFWQETFEAIAKEIDRWKDQIPDRAR
jgi:hypothetical protein